MGVKACVRADQCLAARRLHSIPRLPTTCEGEILSTFLVFVRGEWGGGWLGQAVAQEMKLAGPPAPLLLVASLLFPLRLYEFLCLPWRLSNN